MLFVFFGLCVINSFIFGEEPLPESESPPPDIEAKVDRSQIVYYIRNIDFDSTGRTRPVALLRMGEFKTGERITGEAALEDYVNKKNQLLYNQRVL